MKLRKLLSILLVLCMMLSLAPAAAMAEEPADDGQSLEKRTLPALHAVLDIRAKIARAAGAAESPLVDGDVPVYIVDDTTGQAPEHGSVTLLATFVKANGLNVVIH